MQRITQVRIWPLDVPLLEPFGIAGGAQEIARNVVVGLELEDGTCGLGEAAPFPAVNGETQQSCLEALGSIQELLEWQDVRHYRAVGAVLAEALRHAPSALCAVEIALLDALTRSARLPLWALFGGKQLQLDTDVTIPTGDLEHARRSALRASQKGFTTLKVKIGGGDLDADVARLCTIFEAAPQCGLLLDANASLSAREALELLRRLGPGRDNVVLFEQPTAAGDLDGLSEVEREGRVRVAADESARSPADIARLLRGDVCSVVNLKTAKLGVIGAWDALVALRSAGLGVMMGGMVETELSMTASACLAAGVGGVEFIDLDTPLFLGPRPLSGGFVQDGPRLDLSGIAQGHGVSFHP